MTETLAHPSAQSNSGNSANSANSGNAATTEAAWRAVKRFRAMQPGLQALVRAVGRDPELKLVVAQSGGRAFTDGKKVVIPPPLELGEDFRHNYTWCDRRDPETRQLLCPACQVMEDILVKIFHEASHITAGTFDAANDDDKKATIERAIAQHNSKYAEAIRKRIENAPPAVLSSYLGLANFVSPYLPFLVNALEDVRVNRAMFEARPGTRIMFDAWAARIMADGRVMPDGSIYKWSDRPLNSQVSVGIFCKASDYNTEGWFDPVVEAALEDKEITGLINRLSTVRSVRGVYALAFPMLDRLRELGFMLSEADPEVEDDSNKSQQQQQQQQQEEEQHGSDDAGPSPDGAGNEVANQPTEAQTTTDTSQSSGENQNKEDSDGQENSSSGSSASEDSTSEADDAGGDESSTGSGSEAGGEGSSAGSWTDDSSDGTPEGEEWSSASGRRDSDSSDGDQEATQGDDFESGDFRDGDGDYSSSFSEDLNKRNANPESGSQTADDLGDYEGDAYDTAEQGTGDIDKLDELGDKGEGGIELEHANYGTPIEALEDLVEFGGHTADGELKHSKEATLLEKEAELIDKAINQSQYFETPSNEVDGVRIHEYDKHVIVDGDDESDGWMLVRAGHPPYLLDKLGVTIPERVSEQHLARALMRTRLAFDANARKGHTNNLRAGRVEARKLARRAPGDDDRLFFKTNRPGKRSYFVVIAVDISGSTKGENLRLAKMAAMAQAELCHRVGVKFEVWAHTSTVSYASGFSHYMDMYLVKAANEPWDTKRRTRLRELNAVSGNLDGHSIEFYRKRCEKSQETDKIILYYTDGRMPASNYDEELEILQREIAYCKKKGITLMGVGIRTDSPMRHGLDTVQIDSLDDLEKAVRHLETRLEVKK